jgi:hypothetical protein
MFNPHGNLTRRYNQGVFPSSFDPYSREGYRHPPRQIVPNTIEDATRIHVKVQKEFEDAKDKMVDAKKKFREAQKKMQEADARLDDAKRWGNQDWY